MMRVNWPITGTASETAGSAMRRIQPTGLSKNEGNGPAAGSQLRFTKNSRISKTASQKDGVATHTMLMTRMSWSGQRSR